MIYAYLISGTGFFYACKTFEMPSLAFVGVIIFTGMIAHCKVIRDKKKRIQDWKDELIRKGHIYG